jgi:hypothetical protein
MTINLNGLSTDHWDSQPYMKTWLQERYSADDLRLQLQSEKKVIMKTRNLLVGFEVLTAVVMNSIICLPPA